MRQLLLVLMVGLGMSALSQGTIDSLVLISETEVYFDSNSAIISELESVKIYTVLQQAQAFDSVSYAIIAHTDNVGADDFNVKLSQRRAAAVKTYMAEQQVHSSTIQQEYHGESRPKTANDSEDGRRQNRRATIRAYQLKHLQWIGGRIIDESSGRGVKASIRLHSKTFENEAMSDSTGLFQIAAPEDEVIGLDVRARGYIIESRMLKVKPGLKVDIKMPKIEEGKKFDVKRLFFIGNKDSLMETSKRVLPNVLFLMDENPEVCIEIKGHVNQPNSDNIHPKSWSYHLSIARAKRIYDYLMSEQVDTSRMLYRGYGNWEMLYPKADSESDMAKNRRVEIEFINCDTAKISPNAILSNLYEFRSGVKPSAYRKE